MEKKNILIVGFIAAGVISCSSASIPVGDTFTMTEKLQNTLWYVPGIRDQRQVCFLSDQINVKLGKVLGSQFMDFTLLDQDSQYALYSLNNPLNPSFLATYQVDEKEIKMLIWQSTVVSPKSDILKTLSNKGFSMRLKEIIH